MVDTWLAANPDLHQTSHSRFSDFAYERGKGTSEAGSGLFAQLKSVTQTADDMRLRQAMLTITVFFVGLLAYRWANSKIKEAPANSHDSPP